MLADIQFSGMEVSLVKAMSREIILRQYLDTLKGQYFHILIDYHPPVYAHGQRSGSRQQGHNSRSGEAPARQGLGTAAPNRK